MSNELSINQDIYLQLSYLPVGCRCLSLQLQLLPGTLSTGRVLQIPGPSNPLQLPSAHSSPDAPALGLWPQQHPQP